MYFKQFYVGCLAHASYLIGDKGEAAVVDPSRDVDMYLDEAKAHGLTIKWVLETHLHADFVSGHRELAERTGATIAIGEKAEAAYPHQGLKEGDEIRIGNTVIRALETPGHTPESVSFLVFEHQGDARPWAVLTGDTLFVGDVGRVDILSSRLPVEVLAGMMYDSLQDKLLKLPDETRVYPAHGAGSLCGRSISSETWSTIGRERAMNPGLEPIGREAFIAGATRDVPETPIYFLHSRDLNKAGPALRHDEPMPPMLAPPAFAEKAKQGVAILDTRDAQVYGASHPTGAYHVGLDGQYASWVGTLLHPGDPILVVVERDRMEESVMRLARVGYENVAGLLDGAVEGLKAHGLTLSSIRQTPITAAIKAGAHVLDVRRTGEWENGHAEGATHIPLAQLAARAHELDRSKEWTVVCAGGYRSSIATSLLERAGFTKLVNAAGGMADYQQAGLPVAPGA